MTRASLPLLLVALSAGSFACEGKPQAQSPAPNLSKSAVALPASRGEHSATSAPDSAAIAASAASPASAAVPASDERPQPPAKLTLPADLPLGRPLEVPIEGDRPLRVVHASEVHQEALVYLHGMCGDPEGAEPWLDVALERGTLIVLRATEKCPDRPGYKWPKDLESIQARIDHALSVVKEQRGGLLETERVTLVGYSQGAGRAEKLSNLSRGRYPRVVLGGTPTLPEPAHFSASQTIALLGGEEEDITHMVEGAHLLKDAGRNARFFLLPRAYHGDYGPEGPRVMREVFAYLFD